jgi:hypothetical protein
LLEFKLEVFIQFQTFVRISKNLGEGLHNDFSDKSLEFINESSAKSPNFTNPMPGVEAAGGPEVAIAAPESPE